MLEKGGTHMKDSKELIMLLCKYESPLPSGEDPSLLASGL
jgi:hypothetical protein